MRRLIWAFVVRIWHNTIFLVMWLNYYNCKIYNFSNCFNKWCSFIVNYGNTSLLIWNKFRVKWATSWQNQQNGMCAQQRLRSAWASAQSDQSLHCPHEERSHWAHSKDSDQTGQMPRLIWVFAGHTVILLVLSWGGSNSESFCSWILL